jgi:hypothetical protein
MNDFNAAHKTAIVITKATSAMAYGAELFRGPKPLQFNSIQFYLHSIDPSTG